MKGRSVLTIPYRVVIWCVLSLPLLAEVVRKWIYPSNGVIAGAEAVLLVVAMLSARVWLGARVRAVVALGLASVSWALLSVMVGHNDPALGAVGLRGVAMPLVGLLIGVSVRRRLGTRGMPEAIYKFCGFWLLVMGVVAALQLWLGRGHWINDISPALLADERMGIGDYTAGSLAVEWLFRPTSIFLHTGKFGLVAYVLASYRLFYRSWAQPGALRWLLYTGLELLLLVVTGQRAAVVLYLGALAVIGLAFAGGEEGLKGRLIGLSVFVVIGMSGIVLSTADDPVALVVGGRILSAFPDAVYRVRDNLIVPLGVVLQEWLLMGEGAGAFSLGSAQFGGRPLYEAVAVGTAENGWLRIVAEEGVVGAMLTAALFGLVASAAARGARRRGVSDSEALRESRGVLWWVVFAVISVAAWANTHDVLGNTTGMFFVFSFAGMAMGQGCGGAYGARLAGAVRTAGLHRRPGRASVKL